MMKKRHILHWAIGVMMTPLLGSCTSDNVGREECDIISGQPMTVTSATRATDGRTSSTQFDSGETVWLWALKENTTTEYIKAWQLTAQSGGSFTGTNKYWPSDGSHLNVYALHGNFNNPSITEGSISWSSLSLTHTVETDQTSANNKRLSDLLYSHPSTAFAPNPGSVQLAFDHLLAMITVKLDLNNSVGITASDLSNATVKLTNIQPNATISKPSLTGNSGKTTTTGTRTTISAGKITSSIKSGDVIGSAIVPLQQFGGGKSEASQNNVITITLSDDRSFSYKPATPVALSAGMEYTYTLKIIGKKITGTLSVSPFLSEEDEQISFTDNFDYLADLKNRNYLGSNAAPYDLSLDYNGLMNTANCYVVTQPGYYKLPLVYGNAIKNGATNAIAYGVKDGTSISSTFVNHLGNQITNPYIYINENCTVGSAALVWQDAQDLISNISLCDDNKYIKFEITKTNIQQGNAVIAVKNPGGTIMWSWHIWVTNKNVYETYTYGSSSYKFNFMTIALGERETAQGTTCTFYQWGRKDPFPGATENDQATENMSSQTDYYSSITNPCKFIKGTETEPFYSNWFNENLLDLWNVGNTSTNKYTNKSQKSIYDPSPVGFKVPPPAAFPAIGLIKENWQSTSEKKGISVPDSDDFWRAFGYLFWESGSSAVVGSIGYYWSCGPNEYGSGRHGWYLFFYSDKVDPKNNAYRSYGFSVRPVSE